jgi:hypothetical protein
MTAGRKEETQLVVLAIIAMVSSASQRRAALAALRMVEPADGLIMMLGT